MYETAARITDLEAEIERLTKERDELASLVLVLKDALRKERESRWQDPVIWVGSSANNE